MTKNYKPISFVIIAIKDNNFSNWEVKLEKKLFFLPLLNWINFNGNRIQWSPFLKTIFYEEENPTVQRDHFLSCFSIVDTFKRRFSISSRKSEYLVILSSKARKFQKWFEFFSSLNLSLGWFQLGVPSNYEKLITTLWNITYIS